MSSDPKIRKGVWLLISVGLHLGVIGGAVGIYWWPQEPKESAYEVTLLQGVRPAEPERKDFGGGFG